jgi:hypothetical protein
MEVHEVARKSLTRFLVRARTHTSAEHRSAFLAQAATFGALPCAASPVRSGRAWQDWRFEISGGRNASARRDGAMAMLRLCSEVTFVFHEYVSGDDEALDGGLLIDQFLVNGAPGALAQVESHGCEPIREISRSIVCRTTPRSGVNCAKVAANLNRSNLRARPLLARARPRQAVALVAASEWPWELASDGPVSLRVAALAQRGSSEVTIAIIDDGFRAEDATARIRVVSAVDPDGPPLVPSFTDHGSALVRLIMGGGGYPGVAPGCNLVEILLPTWCTEAEEVHAFEHALKENVAVVCCAWGPPVVEPGASRSIPTLVAGAISRLKARSREGRGALVFFAVGSNASDVALDGYVSYPGVVAVTGATHDATRPLELDTGPAIKLAAPVSGNGKSIGGQPGLPPGASGAAALATGAAALVLSENLTLSANSLLEILQSTAEGFAEGPPVINAVAAADEARRTQGGAAQPDAGPNVTVDDTQPGNVRRSRERRFEGGEHSWLMRNAVSALKNLYHPGQAAESFFGGDLMPFNPPGLPANIQYAQPITGVIQEFLIGEPPTIELGGAATMALVQAIKRLARVQPPGLHLPTAFFDGGPSKLEYAYLVGLAADVYGSPLALASGIDFEGPGVAALASIFENEIANDFSARKSVAAIFGHELARGLDYANFGGLLLKNYPHFAGHNLLFYLSYHLLALAQAKVAAGMPNSNVARVAFVKTLILEAFAAHFLTDMFSAGHARVPRWGQAYGVFRRDVTINVLGFSIPWNVLLARLLHDHEGKLGVVLQNSIDQVWLAKGDSGLEQSSWLFGMMGNSLTEAASGGYPGVGPMVAHSVLPEQLASNLVFVSLLDVFRHFSGVMYPEASARGTAARSNGLLGYVLERLPFAFPLNALTPALRTAFADNFFRQGSGEENRLSLNTRLSDVAALYETFLDSLLGDIPERLYGSLNEFQSEFVENYATVTLCRQAAQAQIDHVRAVFVDGLKDIPSLVGGNFRFASATLDNYRPDNGVTFPARWLDVIPAAMRAGLGSISSWGFV